MVTLASYPVLPHQITGGWTNRWLVVEWLRYSLWVSSAQNDISTADLQGFWAIWKQEQWSFWFGGLKIAPQDFGSFGTSMSGICYDIAKQYWEAWGLFWKRSVSPCFRGVSLGFLFVSVVVVWFWLLFVFCCSAFVLCRRHLVFALTYSPTCGNSQSYQNGLMTVRASSAHGMGTKKSIVDQSLRSSYQPMTILAQLRDCHSCYDERSIVKKKGTGRLVSSLSWWSPKAEAPLILNTPATTPCFNVGKAVGLDFEDKEEFIGSEYHKLLRLEAVPRRWPLARLSISLQKIVDQLDRVLAGCCWKTFATRAVPEAQRLWS